MENAPECGTFSPLFGRANKPSWILPGVAAASVLLLWLPAPSGAERPPAIGRLRAEDAGLAAKARSAVLDLYSLDARLGSARTELGALEARAGRLEAQREAIDQQLRLATLDSRLSEEAVAVRLRYLYDYGTTTSSLDVLLGSSSLEQALTRLDDVNAVAAANQSVLVQLHSAQSHLSRLSRELALHEQSLSQTTSALASTVAELGQAQAQRSSYISSLEQQRAYDSERIGRLDAEAQAAVARSEQLASARAAAEAAAAALAAAKPPQSSLLTVAAPQSVALVVAPAAVGSSAAPQDVGGPQLEPAAALPPPGAQTLTVVATGYDLSGRTATGLPVGYGVAAVDPSVIPLGTRMTIPGYGEAVAADTGGSIVGARIDLWFPTEAQANAWGRRTVTILVGG